MLAFMLAAKAFGFRRQHNYLDIRFCVRLKAKGSFELMLSG